ncbi:ArsR family transcriptional regulator (plasmid) [Rhodococcus erythropolis]|nr:ArsR family transcriptional regulator [Rhodococcus erythropolis]
MLRAGLGAIRSIHGLREVRRQTYAQTEPGLFSGCDIDLWRNRFEAMADPNRLRILCCLSTGPLCVTDMAVDRNDSIGGLACCSYAS